MEYHKWLEANEEELRIECAESGADRELDFDFEKFCEDRYEETMNSLELTMSPSSNGKFRHTIRKGFPGVKWLKYPES